MNNVEPLYTLLQRCTLRIWLQDSPREYATGFFVAQNLVLTCAHVVEDAQDRQVPIVVRWENGDYIAEIEQFRPKPYPDLALLKVNNIGDHPCVYLHKSFS